MGVPLTAVTTDTGDGFRVDLEGEGGEALLWQRGEPLRALQHVVSTAFRRQLGDDVRVLVDCQHFRRDKDVELKQLAKFLVEKARSTGVPQEMGPLNAYERRIVHMAVAELPGASSESIGDASVKTVVISAS
jgi:spoIIIJ-associated protein